MSSLKPNDTKPARLILYHWTTVRVELSQTVAYNEAQSLRISWAECPTYPRPKGRGFLAAGYNKIMRKIIIISLIVLFLIGLGFGLYYLTSTFLPAFAKEKIISSLSDLTEGKVTLKEVRFDLFKGLTISDVVVFDKNNPAEELCRITEMRASFLIPAFFKEKQIVIPSLILSTTTLHLTRYKNNTFNISYLIDKFNGNPQLPADRQTSSDIPQRRDKPSSGKTFSLVVKSVELEDTSILFKDASFEKPLAASLAIEDLSANTLWNKIYLKSSGTLIRDNNKTPFSFQGTYLYTKGLFNGVLAVKNLDTKTYQEYLPPIPVKIDKGLFPVLKISFSFDKNDIKSAVQFNLNDLEINQQKLFLKNAFLRGDITIQVPGQDFSKTLTHGKLMIEKALFSINDPLRAEGTIEKSSLDFDTDKKEAKFASRLNLSGARAEKDTVRIENFTADIAASGVIPLGSPGPTTSLSYEGTAAIKSADAFGIPAIEKITEIQGEIRFKNSDLDFRDISAKTLDSILTAQGTLKENILNLDIQGIFDLDKIARIVPKEVKWPPYKISGSADITLHLTSPLPAKVLPTFSGEAHVENVSLALPESKITFTASQGQVKFDTETQNIQIHSARVNSARVDSFQKIFSLDASLNDFQKPNINLMVIGDDFKFHTDFIKDNDKINISSFEGQYKDASANVKGSLDLKNEDMKLAGTILFDLKSLEKIPLNGKCLINAEVSGPFKNYRLWNIKAKGTSKIIKGYGYKLSNVLLDYRQIEHQGFINSLTFDAYGGKGEIKGRIDFLEKEATYALHGNLNDLDLSQLKLDNPSLKNKTFSGLSSIKIDTEGRGTDPATLKGSGTLNIKNGNIWEFNPLKGLGDFLFIPRFSSLVFTHAQGDFSIQDSTITTDNFELLGPELGLIVEGKITFSGNLDFLVNTQIPKTSIGPIQEFPPAAGQISKAASLTAIKITGTVQNPKYKLQPIGENIMKKLGDLLSNITP